MSGEHTCPAAGCTAQLPFETLACKRHWFSLPPALRSTISRAWRNGDIPAYLEARKYAAVLLGEESRP